MDVLQEIRYRVLGFINWLKVKRCSHPKHSLKFIEDLHPDRPWIRVEDTHMLDANMKVRICTTHVRKSEAKVKCLGCGCVRIMTMEQHNLKEQ